MALLKCYECEHDVSSFIERCPTCDAPVKISENAPPIPIGKRTMKCIDCESVFKEIYEQCPKCGSSNKITAKPGEKIPVSFKTSSTQGAKCPTC